MKKQILLLLMFILTASSYGQINNPSPFPRGIKTPYIIAVTKTTAQLNALGLGINDRVKAFDSTLDKWVAWDGDSWEEFGGGGGAVESVNGQTGVVVLDPDDLDDTSTTNKFATAAELALIGTALQPSNIDNTAYNATSWNGITTIAPSKDAVRDKFVSIDALLASSGNVSKVGTPVDNQIGVWTGDGTIEGDSKLTWDGATMSVTGATGSIGLLENGQIDIVSSSSSRSVSIQPSTLKIEMNNIGNLYTLQLPDNTVARTITFPDATGTVALTSDITSPTTIVGITGNKAEFDTAVTDGNFLYVGDVTTNATHTGEVTGATALTIASSVVDSDNIVNGTIDEVDLDASINASLDLADSALQASSNVNITGAWNFTITELQITAGANMNGSKLTGLDNGTSSSDAVNKSQLDEKISSDGTGRTSAEEITNIYYQTRANYITDGAPSAGVTVLIKDPLNAEGLVGGTTTIDFLNADGVAIPFQYLDNTTDDETAFTLTDMRVMDVVEIYLNQATEPSFTPTVTIKADTLDWTDDSLASTDVTLTVWRNGRGNYEGVYTKGH